MATTEEKREAMDAIADFLAGAWGYQEGDVYPENFFTVTVLDKRVLVYCDRYNLVLYSYADRMVLDVDPTDYRLKKLWTYAKRKKGRCPEGFNA